MLMVRPPTLMLALPSARDHLRQCDIVGIELMQIDVDIVLLGRFRPRYSPARRRERSEAVAATIQSCTVLKLVKTEVWWSESWLVSVYFADQAAWPGSGAIHYSAG